MGKIYLLTFVCEQNGFFDGYPLPSKRDDMVAKGVMELCLRNGAFNEIITDRGTEFSDIRGPRDFTAGLIEKVCFDTIK